MKEKMKGWGEEVKESAQNLSTRAKILRVQEEKLLQPKQMKQQEEVAGALGISSEYCLKPSSYL